MTEQTEAAEVEAALLSVTWPDGGHEGLPTRRTAEMLAPAVLPLIAAAEARGAERVLAAVEAVLTPSDPFASAQTRKERRALAAARAAATGGGS